VGTLYINDEKVGGGQIPRTEGFDIGIDTGTPVTEEYKAGARFTGKIEKVMIDVFGERLIDPEAEIKAVMKSQ
jgi:arylsulfatase